MSTVCTVYAPLTDFLWDGDNFLKFSGLEIRRNQQSFDLHGLDEGLSESQRDELFYADHWLIFESRDTATVSAAEMVNLFLLSLWLAKPTKTCVKLRFEVNQDTTCDQVGTTSVVQDVFTWVPQTVADSLSESDLEDAASYFAEMHRIRVAEKRLHHAIFLTHAGCVAYNWAVALICFASAVEALLTSTKGPKLTNRLSLAFACLTETQRASRDHAYTEFRDLYKVRSDIMHGRIYLTGDLDGLETIARFETALRQLWRVILPSHVTILEEDDNQRQALFRKLQSGYQPPK